MSIWYRKTETHSFLTSSTAMNASCEMLTVPMPFIRSKPRLTPTQAA